MQRLTTRNVAVIRSFTEQDKKVFIQSAFDDETLKKLEHIHTGGKSAAKGQRYEDLFLLRKVLEVASNKTIRGCIRLASMLIYKNENNSL